MKLAEIKALIDAPTPGPWESEFWLNNGGCPTGGFKIPGLTAGATPHFDKEKGMIEMRAKDARFIAQSRTLMPKLLAVAEAVARARDLEKEGDCMGQGNAWQDALVALADLETDE